MERGKANLELTIFLYDFQVKNYFHAFKMALRRTL